MPKLSDLTVRTLQPANYRFTSDVVQALAVREALLEDYVIDFARLKPEYRPVVENDLLQINDVVLGLSGGRGKALLNPIDREITSVGLYHPQIPCLEPVTLAPYTLAFRAPTLAEAVSILAGLIYRLDRRRDLQLSAIRVMPVPLLTNPQVIKFLDLIKTAHEMREKARQRDKLMRELIPATIFKFLKDNGNE